MNSADAGAFEADDRAARAFVAIVWLACVALLASWVARHASPWPWNDDVAMAPFFDPDSGVDATSYWLPHNEHRIPLAKLAFVALVKLTHDFRAGAWVHLALLASLALALPWALRRRTGVTRAADAWIPIALLSPGNVENLLGTFQLAFLLPVALAGALLVAAIVIREPLRARGIAVVWLALIALLLLGSIGFVLALALALWPLHAGWAAWRERSSRSDARAAAIVAVLGVLALGAGAIAYLSGLPPRSTPPDLARVAQVAAQFLTGGLGNGGALYWPATGVVVLAIVAGALFVALHNVLAPGAHAPRPVASAPLLVHLLAALALAFAAGVGRGADGASAGFVERYMMPAALGLAAAFAVWRVLGRGALARVAELLLLTLVVGAWSHGYDHGNTFAAGRHIVDRRFERALEAGAGVRELAAGQWRGFYYGEAEFADALAAWRRAGFYEDVRPGERLESAPPPADVLRVAPDAFDARSTPLEVRAFDDGAAIVARSRVELALDVPGDARSIRVRYAIESFGRGTRCSARLELATSAGARTALVEELRSPRDVVADRGWHELRATLPDVTGGVGASGGGEVSRRRVVLVIEPAAGESLERSPLWILLRDAVFSAGR